jgi:hypothetical protein
VSTLYLYGACVAFGGVMLLASMLIGHDVSGDTGELPAPGGTGGDAHLPGGDHGHGSGGAGSIVASLLSLRFWVFAVTFFGLTGLVLLQLGGAGARALAPLIAAPVGLGAGFVASRVFAALGAKPVGAVAPSSAYVGREARLLLPVSRTQRGKLRLRVGATEVDLLAETDDDGQLPGGASVLIVSVRGQYVVVSRNPAAPADPAADMASDEAAKER